jgi:hypothetical protein
LFSSPEDGKAMTRPDDTTVRNLIADLFRSDEQTGGQPVLAPDQVEVARDYLEQLLLDVTGRLQQHVAGLEKLYQARFIAPLPRSWRRGAAPPVQSPPAGFRHSAVLEEPLALAVLEGGVERLPASDLARLLLNPCALWDLSDLISTVLPDYWLDRMDERGVQLARDSGIDLDADFESVVGLAEEVPSMNTPSIRDLERETAQFFRRHWVEAEIGAKPPVWKHNPTSGRISDMPDYEKGGVYALVEGESVIYVGVGTSRHPKKNRERGIVRRLFNDHVLCRLPGGYELKREWPTVTAVLTLGFEKDQTCLALALEDYLIEKLGPARNKKKRRPPSTG